MVADELAIDPDAGVVVSTLEAEPDLLASEVCRDGDFLFISKRKILFDGVSLTEDIAGYGHGFPVGWFSLLLPELLGSGQLEVPAAVE